MVRAMFSPIIGSNWMYLQHLVVHVFTQVAAGWCHRWDGTELCGLWGVWIHTPHKLHSSVSTHPWHQPAQLGWTLPDPVNAVNPLNPELNPICYLLALLAHHFLHVSRIRVKSLTLRLLMSYIYIYIYIYMEHLFLVFQDHPQRRSTVGRTPLDEWSARRRDLNLTTHDTHNRQISMPPVGLEPTISADERPQAAHLLRLLRIRIRTHNLSRWAAAGRSPAEIVGSDPTGGMDICLLWVSCVVR